MSEEIRNETGTKAAEKIEVVGINFREAGKVYYFSPGKYKLKAGDAVIVETARGVELGTVKMENRLMSSEKIVSPLKPITRLATKEDLERNEKNRKAEADEFTLNFEQPIGKKLNRHLFDPQTLVPDEKAEVIGIDKVYSNVEDSLSDELPPFSVAVYTTYMD